MAVGDGKFHLVDDLPVERNTDLGVDRELHGLGREFDLLAGSHQPAKDTFTLRPHTRNAKYTNCRFLPFTSKVRNVFIGDA